MHKDKQGGRLTAYRCTQGIGLISAVGSIEEQPLGHKYNERENAMDIFYTYHQQLH